MAGNQFGKLFSITTFGESHGEGIGVVIDGCPAGLVITEELIQTDLDMRKPGQSALTTARTEVDKVQILSGVFEGKTLGSPICLFIRNIDHRSEDYDIFKNVYRPSHADFTYDQKYGARDYRGGGRSSARETAARVAAGAVAKALIGFYGIEIFAYVSQVGEIKIDKHYSELDFATRENNLVRCPDVYWAAKMEQEIATAKTDLDSVGGVISCVIKNCPVGLGEPVFDKLPADLGKAMLSINAVKGFEIGEGFVAAAMRGSTHNDFFETKDQRIITKTNHSGGVQGGISNGMDIFFRTAFKPVATIGKAQETINDQGEFISLEAKGRHDPCVVPRAVPIVEAMAALVLADHLLRNRSAKV